MKTNIVSKVLLAATLSAFALVPASALPSSGVAYNVSRVLSSPDEITRGDTRQAVLRQMGRPHLQLAPNIWVYRNFGASQKPETAQDGCGTLIVTLGAGRVKDLKLVNGDAFEVYERAVRTGVRLRFTEAPILAAE